MPFEFDIKSDVERLTRRLDNLGRREIPFALSRAMEKTVTDARDDVYKTIPKAFDRPSTAFLKKGNRRTNSGFRSGWIRADWPSKGQIKSGRKLQASVYVWGVPSEAGSTNKNAKNVAEALGRNIFGWRRDSVSINTPAALGLTHKVIVPTPVLLARGGKADPHKRIKLNKFGNITSLRKRLVEVMADKRRYLVIKTKSIRQRGLPPGVYARVLAPYEYKRGPTSRARGVKQLRTVRLVPLLWFRDTRDYEVKWDFPQIVNRSYRKEFNRHFKRELRSAVRDGRRRFGR